MAMSSQSVPKLQQALGRGAADRRTLCPMINQKVIEVAGGGNVPALLSTIAHFLPDMNLVNLTTSLHRIAKLCVDNPAWRTFLSEEAQRRLLDELLLTINVHLMRLGTEFHDPQRHSLSNVLWSLGTLRIVHLPVVRTAVAIAGMQLDEFRPVDLVSTVWGLAKLGSMHPAVLQLTAPMHEDALRRVSAYAGKLGYRFLVMAAWSATAWGQRDAAMFALLGKRVLPMLRHAESSPETLVEVAWAFGASGSQHQSVMAEVAWQACYQIDHFREVELSALCRLLHSERIHCWDFFTVAASRALAMRLQPEQLAAVAVAVLRACPDRSAVDVALPLLRQLTPLLQHFDGTSLASVAWTVMQSLRDLQLLPQGADTDGRPEVSVPLEFFTAVAMAAMQKVKTLPMQSLAELTMVAVHVRAVVPPMLQTLLAEQVQAEADSFSQVALLQLMTQFSATRCGNGAYAQAAAALFVRAARQIQDFSEDRLQALERVCGGGPRSPGIAAWSRAQVAAACSDLARGLVPGVAKPDGLQALAVAQECSAAEQTNQNCGQINRLSAGATTGTCNHQSEGSDFSLEWASETTGGAASPVEDGLRLPVAQGSSIQRRSTIDGSCRLPGSDLAGGALCRTELVIRNTFLELTDADSVSPTSSGMPVLDAVLEHVSPKELEDGRAQFQQFGLW